MHNLRTSQVFGKATGTSIQDSDVLFATDYCNNPKLSRPSIAQKGGDICDGILSEVCAVPEGPCYVWCAQSQRERTLQETSKMLRRSNWKLSRSLETVQRIQTKPSLKETKNLEIAQTLTTVRINSSGFVCSQGNHHTVSVSPINDVNKSLFARKP